MKKITKCLSIILVAVIISTTCLTVFAAKQSFSQKNMEVDFSNMLGDMFEKAYSLGNFEKLPRYNGVPYLSLEIDEEFYDIAQFKQQLEKLAKEKGYYCNLSDETQVEEAPVKSTASLQVIVNTKQYDEASYEVELTIWVTPSFSTSVSALATIDSLTGDVSYKITKYAQA